MAEKKQALLLFSKPPVPGMVKTRLTTEHDGFLSPAQAAEFFKRSLYDVSELAMHALMELQMENDAAVAADPSVDKVTYDFFVSTTPAENVELMKETYDAIGPWPMEIHYMTDKGATFDDHFDYAFKEIFAQGIHMASPFRNGPFVGINCTALPESLLESELFGYAEGAFTGAKKGGKVGLFEMAHNGTLFLDEIGEIPTSVQAKLLRVLEEKIVMRIGQERYIPINVRIVCATNKDLAELVRCGKFREDLFYRLNVLRLNLPPLRKHPEDIEELADSFLSWLPQSLSLPRPQISPEALAVLKLYHFPGNIRELRNVIERLVVIAKGREIRESDISRVLLMNEAPCGNSHKKAVTVPPSPSAPADANRRTKQSMLRAQINSTILQVLEETQGNKAETARRLGISPATLWRKLKAIAAQEKK